MTEKYYIVSDSELERLKHYAYEYGSRSNMYDADCIYDSVKQAEAACHAREVPGWATHFAEVIIEKWDDGDVIDYTYSEEIKR